MMALCCLSFFDTPELNVAGEVDPGRPLLLPVNKHQDRVGFSAVTRWCSASSLMSALPCRRRVKLWASAFGGEIKSISAKYSGSQLLQKVSGLVRTPPLTAAAAFAVDAAETFARLG